jgi:hypothetical protein
MRVHSSAKDPYAAVDFVETSAFSPFALSAACVVLAATGALGITESASGFAANGHLAQCVRS